MQDTAYSLENATDDPACVEKQTTPDQNSTEQTSKRPTRYNTQTVQITLKSPSKSPGKSPRQMELVRQRSEASRGRSRGPRNSSGGRGTTNRAPASSRGRGRGRTAHVVPIGNIFQYKMLC